MREIVRTIIVVLCVPAACAGCGERATRAPGSTAEPSAPAPQPLAPDPAGTTAPSGAAADGTCTITRDADTSTFTYASGRLVRSTWSRDRRTTTYTYEGDRLVRVERRNPDSLFFTLEIAYGDGGRVHEVVQRQTDIADAERTRLSRVAFTYGPDGRLRQAAKTGDDGSSRTTFEYDARGRLTEQTLDFGDGDTMPMRMAYDAAGRLESVDAQTQRWAHSYGPSGLRERTTMTTPEGDLLSVEERRYDRAGRLVEIRRGDHVERFTYEGTFGATPECGELGGSPDGVPDDYAWLGIEP